MLVTCLCMHQIQKLQIETSSQNSSVRENSMSTNFISRYILKITYFDLTSLTYYTFQNHTDAWCHKNCDPNEEPELKDMNTEICEQLFVGIKQHKNC